MSGRALLSNRGYLLYRGARFVSVLGSQLSAIAYPLLVLAIWGQPAQAGAVASCLLVVRTVARIPAGHLADRLSPRWVMIGADLVRLLALGSIPLAAAAGVLTYPQLLAVAALEGLASALFAPAATIFLREIVAQADIARALGQSQASQAALSMAGPVAGGLLFAMGHMLPFVADAGSYAVSAVLMLAVGARAVRAAGHDAGPVDRRMTAGLRWLWRHPAVMRVVLFASALNVAAAAANVAVILVLREHGARSAVIGLVMACPGAGAVLGALLAHHIMVRLGRGRLYAAIGSAWVAGLALAALSGSPWVLGPVLIVLFFLSPAAGIMLSKITVDEAPHDQLGRVSTAEQSISSGLAPAGPLAAGLILESLGAAPMWLALAAICLLATIATVARGRTPARTVPGVPAAGGPEGVSP